jgi:hypothetical protein
MERGSMSAVILDFATHARRAFRREAEVIRKETKEEIVHRVVMKRCLEAGVPIRMAQIQAASAAESVRLGHESSKAADRAVKRAIAGAFPDGPEAA